MATFRYHGRARYVKRALDLALVVVGLPVVIPVAVVTAGLIKLTSPGPVLFRQERVGQHGRPFRIVKFRTMVVDAEERLRADPDLYALYVSHDHKLPPDEDPRLTRIGRLLRRTSLDELPQLWNVATGAMSLVGPRPVTPEQLDDWGDGAFWYLQARPGLTGLWQVSGRSGIKSDDRVAYDRNYLETWTPWLDLKVMALTPLAVLSARGAH